MGGVRLRRPAPHLCTHCLAPFPHRPFAPYPDLFFSQMCPGTCVFHVHHHLPLRVTRSDAGQGRAERCLRKGNLQRDFGSNPRLYHHRIEVSGLEGGHSACKFIRHPCATAAAHALHQSPHDAAHPSGKLAASQFSVANARHGAAGGDELSPPPKHARCPPLGLAAAHEIERDIEFALRRQLVGKRADPVVNRLVRAQPLHHLRVRPAANGSDVHASPRVSPQQLQQDRAQAPRGADHEAAAALGGQMGTLVHIAGHEGTHSRGRGLDEGDVAFRGDRHDVTLQRQGLLGPRPGQAVVQGVLHSAHAVSCRQLLDVRSHRQDHPGVLAAAHQRVGHCGRAAVRDPPTHGRVLTQGNVIHVDGAGLDRNQYLPLHWGGRWHRDVAKRNGVCHGAFRTELSQM